MTSPWIVWFRKSTAPRLTLVAFHYAGGSAAVFRPWLRFLPLNVDLLALQMPGRWERLDEPLMTDVHTVARESFDALKGELSSPFVLVGYSLGAIIAFEVARMLESYSRESRLKHLLILSRDAPQTLCLHSRIHHLSDQDFVAELKLRYGSGQPSAFDDPDLRQILLPINRADMKMLETFNFQTDPPLNTPITVWKGKDDQTLSDENVRKWSTLTKSRCDIRDLDGGHFFPLSNEQVFSNALLSLIQTWEA